MNSYRRSQNNTSGYFTYRTIEFWKSSQESLTVRWKNIEETEGEHILIKIKILFPLILNNKSISIKNRMG